MTESEVWSIIGPAQFIKRDPDDPRLTCMSHIYDEVIDAKFVHVLLHDGRVIRASDEHRKTCDF